MPSRMQSEDLVAPGRIGIVTRSAPLAREVGRQLSAFGLGASKVVVLPAQDLTHLALLKTFQCHWGTDAVLLLGAIDAAEAQACTDWIAHHMDKPVIGFIEDGDPAQEQQWLDQVSAISPEAFCVRPCTSNRSGVRWCGS